MKNWMNLSRIPTKNWMEFLMHYSSTFKYKRLIDLTIPGSHDAATYTMQGHNPGINAFAVTQCKTLAEQFDLGVRYFDIRVRRSRLDKKSLCFFHGPVTSDKKDVFPQINKFLTSILASKEVVILKMHFSSSKDFLLFKDMFISKDVERCIVTPADLKNQNIGQMIGNNKNIVLLTKKGGEDSDINCDYHSNAVGGWANTRLAGHLTANMNAVRANIGEDCHDKIKIIQTNQPALSGSGWNDRATGVRKHDEKAENRTITENFVKESREYLIDALKSKNRIVIDKVRQAVRGVISLDNIGSDENKNRLIQRIIELNDDQELLISVNDGYVDSKTLAQVGNDLQSDGWM